MLDDIKSEAYKCKSSVDKPKMIITDGYEGGEAMMKMESRPVPESGTDISPILRKIDRAKRDIKKH
jgi:hypothetical protein